MKPTFARLTILVLSMVLGLTISLYSKDHDVSDQLIPPIDNAPPLERICFPLLKSAVISIPADDEFYVGKQRFELSQIREVVMRSLNTIPRDERIVYLKPATGVRSDTLTLVIKEVKFAGVDRIEIVLDKKKTHS